MCGCLFTGVCVSSVQLLTAHYVDMFGRADQKHVQYFRDRPQLCNRVSQCGACGVLFCRPVDLFQHVRAKSNVRRTTDGEDHKLFFNDIAECFVGKFLFLIGEFVREFKVLFGCDNLICNACPIETWFMYIIIQSHLILPIYVFY